MVIYREKLFKAKEILQEHYSDKITQIILEDERPILKIEFNLGNILYIRYNDFDEYYTNYYFLSKNMIELDLIIMIKFGMCLHNQIIFILEEKKMQSRVR